MPRTDNAAPTCPWIECNTHPGHKQTSCERCAEVIVYGLHNFAGFAVFRASMMKQQFCQGGEKRRGSSVACCINDPEKDSAVDQTQPTINITSHLNNRAVTGRDVPTWQSRWFLWNKRLLGQSGSRQIPFEISTPGFEFVVLLLQLNSE